MSTARHSPSPDSIVPVMLNGGRVTASFRSALFSAAAREGVSVNEYCLRSAAEKLHQMGADVTGAFEPGDLINHNDNASNGSN